MIDLYCVKPIDGKALAEQIDATGGRLVTVEDHWPEGGVGEAVLGALAQAGVAPSKYRTARGNGNAALRQAGRAGGRVRNFRAAHRRSREGHFITCSPRNLTMRPPCCTSGGGIDDAAAVFAGASDTTRRIDDASVVLQERATQGIG